jgi:hypothetical protein
MITRNFLAEQNSISAYIKEHYSQYIPENYPGPNEYTCEFFDSDRFKKNFTLFFDFERYSFDWKTNESELQETELTVYLLVRNDTQEKIREKLLQYTTAFYQMFDESKQCFEGAVDYAKISAITLYYVVEGSQYMKVAEINLILRTEI